MRIERFNRALEVCRVKSVLSLFNEHIRQGWIQFDGTLKIGACCFRISLPVVKFAEFEVNVVEVPYRQFHFQIAWFRCDDFKRFLVVFDCAFNVPRVCRQRASVKSGARVIGEHGHRFVDVCHRFFGRHLAFKIGTQCVKQFRLQTRH